MDVFLPLTLWRRRSRYLLTRQSTRLARSCRHACCQPYWLWLRRRRQAGGREGVSVSVQLRGGCAADFRTAVHSRRVLEGTE